MTTEEYLKEFIGSLTVQLAIKNALCDSLTAENIKLKADQPKVEAPSKVEAP